MTEKALVAAKVGPNQTEQMEFELPDIRSTARS